MADTNIDRPPSPWLGRYGVGEFYEPGEPVRPFEDDLYFIANESACKIGRSKHPLKRMAELQGASPVKLELLVVLPRMGWQERVWHVAFRRYRLEREWFDGLATHDAMWAAHRGEQWIPHVQAQSRHEAQHLLALERLADREESIFCALAFPKTLEIPA